MSVNQGEHTFEVDILKHGRKLRGFTAGEDLDAGQPVAITGDRTVTAASDGGPVIGVAGYSVSAGQEIVILGDDCEVRLPNVPGPAPAGAEVTPTGNTVASGNDLVRPAGSSDNGFAITVTSGSGDATPTVVYIKAASGTTV